jgi:hypothetical protein
MILRLFACFLLVFSTSLAWPNQSQQVKPEAPVKATVCQLKNDPAAYNHKLVEVTAFVSHGFEDFAMFDTACNTWPDIWLEYGGTTGSPTMYCCGVTPSNKRSKPLVVENIQVDLVGDKRFNEFDTLINSQPDTIARATVVGRFFAGEKQEHRGGRWGGYGHMGCCTLLAIQQVLSVDPHRSRLLDYQSTADPSGLAKADCYGELTRIDDRFTPLIKAQERADSGEEAWAFNDPLRVATHGLAQILKIDESTVRLRLTERAQGQFSYRWQPKRNGNVYLVVVSRPYILKFSAKDPNRVAWVLRTVYEVGCTENVKPIRRIN